MIARVHFEGVTRKGKKKSILDDSIDIHAIDLDTAKGIFEFWIKKIVGLRGNSGIFHQIDADLEGCTEKFNYVKLKKVEEAK